MSTKASLEEQLSSQCYGSIQPPLIPEIRVCAFKSDPTQPADDRAFVVVRVAPSSAAPHATRENHVYVRAGSESRLADLTTLRALFESQQQREKRLSELAARVRGRGEVVFNRFAPEWQGDTDYSPRWQQRWPAVIAEFIPQDASLPLLSFVPKGIGAPTLDDHIVHLLRGEGWVTAKDFVGVKADDIVREPEGLGVVAPFTATIQSVTKDMFWSMAPTTWYIDRSGGGLLVIPEASLRWPPTIVPQAQLPNEPAQITPLLYQLRSATNALWQLLHEYGQTGRVQASVWLWQGQNWHGSSQPFDYGIEHDHHGQVMLGLEDPWETRAQDLASLVSQLTRSWLRYPFVIQTWAVTGLPVLG